MVAVSIAKNATTVEIAGIGVLVIGPFELEPGLTLLPGGPSINMDEAAKSARDFVDYAAVVRNEPFVTFSLRVEEAQNDALAAKGWNSLWDFHLLSVAARRPCCSIYSVSRGPEDLALSVANRNIIFNPPAPSEILSDDLEWMKANRGRFHALIGDKHFNTAMRCYANSHYLFDLDMRVMLLWSGIEGLLSVDAELTRRIALHAAMMLVGTPEEKVAHFDRVKKAYNIRSKAVHGGDATNAQLETGYAEASLILIALLRRCVELGRVPSAKELDGLAAGITVA